MTCRDTCGCIHRYVGHTYNSGVNIRSAECACGKATLPVRTIFIHTCSLYENVVNGTKVAWYKVVNTTQLEILAGSKNRLGLGLDCGHYIYARRDAMYGVGL